MATAGATAGARRRGRSYTWPATPANDQDRAQVEELAARVQQVTGDTIELASVDQRYRGGDAETATHG